MSAATHNVKKVAEYRQRILSLLLNNTPLVDGILGRPGDEKQLSEGELLNHTAEITHLLQDMHAADLADLLEALPQDERLALWRLVDNNKRGQTLVEVAEPVWDSRSKR